MLPGADRLREIAVSTDGVISEVPYAVLLAALALTKSDRVAVLERRWTQKRIAFAKGVPVDCRSNLLHETFGRYLVTQGKISEEAFEEIQKESTASGVRFGEIVVKRNLLTKEDVTRLLQQNLAHKLLDGFTWRDGTYRLVSEAVPADEGAPKLNVAQLILTGVSKFAPQAAVDAAVGTLIGKRLGLLPDPPFPLQEMRLSETQSRLVKALEKNVRIDELATAVALPFEEITRLLYALWLLGTVGPAEAAPAPPKPAPPSIAPAAPPVSAPPPVAAPRPPAAPIAPPEASRSSPDVARRREEVTRAWEGHKGRDAFDLLEVPDDAESDAILPRYLEKARAWAPWDLGGDSRDEVKEKATSLFAAAARAYAKLADPEARQALRDLRRRPISQAPKTSQQFTIRTDLLDPEAQFRKGSDLLAAGKTSQALSFLEFAADCNPQNGTYAATATWCRYLASGQMAKSTTLSELEDATRIDAKSGIAHFYAGELCRAMGDLFRAETFYRKAARLMAPDRRALDALRQMGKEAK